jgi:hypothetical protein
MINIMIKKLEDLILELKEANKENAIQKIEIDYNYNKEDVSSIDVEISFKK